MLLGAEDSAAGNFTVGFAPGVVMSELAGLD
jgi:hypothetical protein